MFLDAMLHTMSLQIPKESLAALPHMEVAGCWASCLYFLPGVICKTLYVKGISKVFLHQTPAVPAPQCTEVPLGQGQIGCVNSPLTSGEVRRFIKELKSSTEDPIRVAEQLDQFLGPNLYSWMEMMSIMDMLFTGEERGMIRRAATQEWEKNNPPGRPGLVPAEQK